MSRLEIAGDGSQGGSGASSNSGGDSSGGGKSSMSGSAGKSMQGGSENGDSGAPDPGGSSSGGTGNAAGDGGTGNTAGDGSMSGSGGSGGSGGSAGAGGTGPDPNAVVKTLGCGKQNTLNTGNSKNTIQTSGTKEAGCEATYQGAPKCGAWSTPRDFYVYLPTNYDPNRAYPVVLLTPGCGSTGTSIYGLNTLTDDIIRVGLTPAPITLGHGTNPGQGCFDDKEGDDSLDFVFYETLMDKLDGELCIDRNRVFAGGMGAWLANELGCKYAGDSEHPIRGVLATAGGLPTAPEYRPTCTDKPLAGIWIHSLDDMVDGFEFTEAAVDRALQVNGCATSAYAQSTFVDYPIGGAQANNTCKKIVNCPAAFPLVVCALPGEQHGSLDQIANPAYGTFVTELMAP